MGVDSIWISWSTTDFQSKEPETNPDMEMPAMDKKGNESTGGIGTFGSAVERQIKFTKSPKLNLTVADISTRQEKLPGRRDSEPIHTESECDTDVALRIKEDHHVSCH